MRIKSFLCLLALLIIFSRCDKRESPKPQPIIDSDFRAYVDRFKSEAESRGVKLEYSQLSVIYTDTLKNYCGWGNYTTKQVLISSLNGCWQTMSDMGMEILIFHELGHALLGRVHDNSKLPNGDYKTMMFAGYESYTYNEDTPERRKYYLDELFHPSTQAPSWSVDKTIPTVIFKDLLSAASNSWLYKSNGTQQGELSHSVFLSPSTSLQIKSAASTSLSYWYATIIPQGINQSDKLILKVNIKLQNVTNGGVYIALRGDKDTGVNFFDSSMYEQTIRGNSDFTEYSVAVPYFISTTKKIYMFLMLNGGATGTVNFDDITLTKYQ